MPQTVTVVTLETFRTCESCGKRILKNKDAVVVQDKLKKRYQYMKGKPVYYHKSCFFKK